MIDIWPALLPIVLTAAVAGLRWSRRWLTLRRRSARDRGYIATYDGAADRVEAQPLFAFAGMKVGRIGSIVHGARRMRLMPTATSGVFEAHVTDESESDFRQLLIEIPKTAYVAPFVPEVVRAAYAVSIANLPEPTRESWMELFRTALSDDADFSATFGRIDGQLSAPEQRDPRWIWRRVRRNEKQALVEAYRPIFLQLMQEQMTEPDKRLARAAETAAAIVADIVYQARLSGARVPA